MNDLLIKGRVRDLGGFSVVRALPYAKKRSIGPFVFLDHMGPMRVSDTSKLDVRPHPHIGLSTVTYLYSGKAYHRDSLGSTQEIKPGELNWMTAGKGIVHSERTPESEIDKNHPKSINGIQIWVALPKEFEKVEPSFTHYGSEVLPHITLAEGLTGTLLIGDHREISSPVKTYSKMIFIEATANTEVSTELNINEKEIGIFLTEGNAIINGKALEVDDLIFIEDPSRINLKLSLGAKIVIIGGMPFPEPRYIWWNFVASEKEDIHRAAQMWKDQLFDKVPGETEFTPLPSDPLP